MTGKQWERAIALENQELFGEDRALMTRVPTHYYDGNPSNDPKSDFVGLLHGGQFVAIEAKAESGTLKHTQRQYLTAVARFGGLALVYRRIDGARYLCPVGVDGKMARKSETTRIKGRWADEF